MDLSAFDTASGVAKLYLIAPNGVQLLKDESLPEETRFADENKVSISLISKDSDTYVQRINSLSNRRANMGKNAKITAEGLRADNILTLAHCTTGWDGIELDGAVIPFSHAAAISLYTKFRWIADLVEAFIHERENFLTASQTN